MIKPPNNKASNIAAATTTQETTMVWNTDARKHDMDADDKCTANNRITWYKNLDI